MKTLIQTLMTLTVCCGKCMAEAGIFKAKYANAVVWCPGPLYVHNITTILWLIMRHAEVCLFFRSESQNPAIFHYCKNAILMLCLVYQFQLVVCEVYLPRHQTLIQEIAHFVYSLFIETKPYACELWHVNDRIPYLFSERRTGTTTDVSKYSICIHVWWDAHY